MNGSHRSGGHRAHGGEFGEFDEFGRPREPVSRRSPGSGGHRTGSGSHRIVRERRTGRRLAVILTGAVVGAGVCVLAAAAIMSGLGVGGERDAGQVVGSGAAESSPASSPERSLVPDACRLIDEALADRLAPNAERVQADNYQSSDRQNQCVWGAYTGDRKRQLTVELRAIEGAPAQSPTEVALRTFESERQADESGKSLLAGQKLTETTRLTDVGEQGYVVYSVDDGQGSGEAIANVRVTNVLVTVHYSGGNDGSPLSASDATGGALDAVKAAIQGLGDAS